MRDADLLDAMACPANVKGRYREVSDRSLQRSDISCELSYEICELTLGVQAVHRALQFAVKNLANAIECPLYGVIDSCAVGL